MLCGLCMLAIATTVSAEETFACHVITQGNQPGIIFVQTDNIYTAEKVALRNRARLPDGSKSPVTEVIECINPKTSEFQDEQIREYMKSMAR